MKIEGQHRFDGSQQEVWDLMQDPEVWRNAMPGVKEWKEAGPNQYEMTIKIAVAGIGGTYSGKVGLQDHDPPRHYRLVMEGSSALGFVKGAGDVNLSEENGKTVMHYAAEVQLGGTLASVGQRLAGVVSKPLIGQGFKALDRQLKERREARKVS